MICILGTSHAPNYFRKAAEMKGIEQTDDIREASLVLIAQDARIGENGVRDLSEVAPYVAYAVAMTGCPIVLSTQVTPGFCRQLNIPRLYHMAETLRMMDALERALRPEQFIIGCMSPAEPLPKALRDYLAEFGCPVWTLTYEEAEFSKIAINAFLAAQVDCTNRLASVATKVGCDWHKVARVLSHDRRIGRWAYLTPGRWRDSQHLLRDMVWLESAEGYGPDQ